MRILLHTCCAPCSGAIIETLSLEKSLPTIFYSNSNIHPREEYDIRRDECRRYCAATGCEFVEDVYDHAEWLRTCAEGRESEPERGSRCLECFKMRLLRAARYALEHGYDTLTTTLASSRWKNIDQINAAGRWAVETALQERPGANSGLETGGDSAPALVWWDRNWRKGGLQQRRSEIIREQNFYNQTFCGCEFSKK